MSRSYDETPLGRSAGVRASLRALGSNPLLVVAATIGVLLLAVPLVVLVALLATDSLPDDGGVLLFLGFLGLCGVLVVADLGKRSGGGGRLEGFAAANGLALVPPGPLGGAAAHVPSGDLVVQQGVRTAGPLAVEVGDAVVLRPRGADGRAPSVYLRARLPGVLPSGLAADGVLTPELAAEARRWAGEHHLQVGGDELVLLGSRPLAPSRRGRVVDGLRLAERLGARAEAVLPLVPADATHEPGPTTSGVPVPAFPAAPPSGRGRRRGAGRVVLLTLALLVVAPLTFAVVMSVLDDHLRGATAAQVVVGLAVSALAAVTACWVRRLGTRA